MKDSIFHSLGFKISAVLFAANWLNLITLNQLAVGLLIILVLFLIDYGRRKLEVQQIPYRPFKLKEIPELEEMIFRDTHRNIQLGTDRMRGEPEFGQGAAEPYLMHFQGLETLSNGTTAWTKVGISLRTPERSFVIMEKNKLPFDNKDKYWTGNPKPVSRLEEIKERVYVPKPTYISSAVPTPKDEEEKGEEHE